MKEVKKRRMIIVVECEIVDKEGRVIMEKSKVGKKIEGMWEFKGGKVEKGEKKEEKMIRELKEEIGIKKKIK